MSEDRTYWHVPGAKAWHAEAGAGLKNGTDRRWFVAICGRSGSDTRNQLLDINDRIPPTAHFCGNCARIIAARTDVEE